MDIVSHSYEYLDMALRYGEFGRLWLKLVGGADFFDVVDYVFS